MLLKEEKIDVAFGSRFLNRSNDVPVIRRFYNYIASFITYFLTSIWLLDSQSGLKAFNRKAIECIQISTNGFEFCTEIITLVKDNKLKYKELPISVVYTKESKAKGQSFATGLSTLFKLVLQALTR